MSALKRYSNTVIIPTGGIGSITFTPPSTYEWEVNQIAVSSTGTAVSTASVSIDGQFICGSNNGDQDSADGSPLLVNNGSTMTITWVGATVGSTCTATIQTTEVEIGAGT
jgi:hypothetical protein